MPEIQVPDGTVSYAATGEGAPVMLLHGFTQSSRSWQEVAGMLPGGYRVVVPDLRGHGATRVRGPHTMDACLADLAAIWAAERIDRTHLVGYSMGGRLALHVAAHRPERLLSLATIGAHAGMADESRERRRQNDEDLASRIEARGAQEFAEYWGSLPMFKGLERRGPAFRAAIDAERRRNSSSGLAASLRGMGAGAMDPVWTLLPNITCPCLFIAGAEDHGYANEARRLADAVPDGRVEIVPRSGHAAHLERPQAVAALLAAHFSEAAPGTP